MKHAKRIITILIISILTISAVFISYIGIENGAVVFAEDIQYMTDEELDAAINAYIESKGGSMLGTVGARMAYSEGKLYNFLTSSDNATPIKNIEDLKSGLSWNRQTLEGMDSRKALMLSVTPTANSCLASYLVWLRQQHYFGNGVNENENGMFDDGVDNNLYTGYSCDGQLCWVVKDFVRGSGDPNDWIITKGTWLVNGATLNAAYNNGARSYAFNVLGNTYSYAMYKDSLIGTDDILSLTGNNYVYQSESYAYKYGGVTYLYNRNNSTMYFGTIFVGADWRGNDYLCIRDLRSVNSVNYDNVNINFYTNNNNNITVFPTISDPDANLYITPKVNVGLNGEVDYQPYIVNEGDNITNIVNNYYTDSGTKDKTITVPSDDPTAGGSSDGPTGGNPPNWTNPFPHLTPDGEGGFNFNFQLPDLNIDWNISGLTEKFPFSIPFDFVAFCRVLDAEPETPALQCDIDLKLVTWHVDYDLHQFDDIASLLRNLEFIAFCIALVIMTRNMIKG